MMLRPKFSRLRPFGQLGAAWLSISLAACSGIADAPQQLGAGDAPAVGATLSSSQTAGVVGPTAAAKAGAVATVQTASAPGGAAAAPGQRPAAGTAEQRCTALRQEGALWERTRKLAVLNRGEAGGRMADLHTPWTKENVSFYLSSCQGRRPSNRLPAQTRASTDTALNR